MQLISKYIIIIGIILILVGTILYFFHNKVSFLFRLPGDIRIEQDNFSLYIPLTTMFLFSIALTGLIWIIEKISKLY